MIKDLRGTLAALILVLAAAPIAAAGPLADKAPEAAVLEADARAGGAAVIVELAVPALAAAEAAGDDASREAAVAAAVDGFVARFFTGREAAEKRQSVKTMRYAPLVAFVATPQELARLAADPSVVAVHEDGMNDFQLIQSVPLVGMPELWEDEGGAGRGQGTVVAIVDSGVQSSHPFVRGRVIRQACFSSAQKKGKKRTVSLCPNGRDSQIGGNAGENCKLEGCEHGTHVAGIAAGRNRKGGSDDRPATGIAPLADIVAIKVAAEVAATGAVTVNDSDWIAALEYLYKERRTIGRGKRLVSINMSLGSKPKHKTPCGGNPGRTIIRLLREAGVATVISTGNEYKTAELGQPACIPEAVRVGSTTKDDVISAFSNAADYMDLFAPGSDILSSVPVNKYDVMSGTSMATPMVTGAFAALASAKPDASVDEILASLVATGKPIKDTRFGGTVVKPRIQVDEALRDLKIGESNLLATPHAPILLESNDGRGQAFTVDLSAGKGTERWRLVSAPDWVKTSKTAGSVDRTGERIRFRTTPLARKQTARTGWLVFAATRKGSPTLMVRVDQRRIEPVVVVDFGHKSPLVVTMRNGAPHPSEFTIEVYTTNGKAPFEIQHSSWVKPAKTKGVATTERQKITVRMVTSPWDERAVGGISVTQTDLAYEAAFLELRLQKKGASPSAGDLASAEAAE